MLVTDPAYLELAQGLGVDVTSFDAFQRERAAPAREAIDGGSFVQFTSGSTASPKGVLLSHEALGSHVEMLLDATEAEAEEHLCTWLPLSHDMGLMTLLTGICAGGRLWGVKGTITLIAPETFLSDPACWLRVISERRCTFSVAPPFALGVAARLLRVGLRGLDLAPLSELIVGAEPIRGDVLRAFSEAAQPYGFDATAISPAYGLAEATLGVSMVRRREHWCSERVDAQVLGENRWSPELSADTEGGHGSIELVGCGTALRGVEVRVEPTDADHEVGNIQVRGPSMLSGYLSAGGISQARDDDGWFTTGDLGFVDPSGELFVVGRNDDMIFAAGRNLLAREIEAVASGHPLVRAGNCVAVPTEDGRYIVVCEPTSEDAAASRCNGAAREIKSLLAVSLNASPRDVIFVPRGSIPKTPSGKVRRRDLLCALRSASIPRLTGGT